MTHNYLCTIKIRLLKLYFVFLFTCLFACDNHKIYKEYYSNGSLKYEVETVGTTLDGHHREYYPNGKLKFKAVYLNGLLEGTSTTYYESGKVMEKKIWVDGKLDGVFKAYYENGNVEQTYKNVKGRIEDTLYYYYSNGSIKGKTLYTNGVKKGKAVEFFKTGELKREFYWGNYYWIPKDTILNGILWYKEYDKKGNLIKIENVVKVEADKDFNNDVYRFKIKLLGAQNEKITVYFGGFDENYQYIGGVQDTIYSSSLEATYLYKPKRRGKNIIRGVIRDWKERMNETGGKNIDNNFAYFTYVLNVN